MTGNSAYTTTVSGLRNECYDDSDEDGDSSNLEVDGCHELSGFDLSAMEEIRHGTTIVNMRDSMNVEIKPATHIHGTLTINQYLNGHSLPQNCIQPGLEAPLTQRSSQNSGSISANKEDPDLCETLEKTDQKCYHFLKSSICCKLGSIFAVTGAISICFAIVYLTILKNDTSEVTPNFPPPPPEEGDSDLGHDIHIIRRSRWGGRPILDGYQNRTLVHPIKLVIIGHTGGRQCISVENCSSTLQSIQVMHVRKGWVDVGLNFLIGGDGNVYETLAWNIRNYIRNNSIMISFFGNYEYDSVKERQKMALELLLNQGVKLGKLDPNYRLVAHSQVANTLSPGTNLLKVIKQLSHWYNGTLT